MPIIEHVLLFKEPGTTIWHLADNVRRTHAEACNTSRDWPRQYSTAHVLEAHDEMSPLAIGRIERIEPGPIMRTRHTTSIVGPSIVIRNDRGQRCVGPMCMTCAIRAEEILQRNTEPPAPPIHEFSVEKIHSHSLIAGLQTYTVTAEDAGITQGQWPPKINLQYSTTCVLYHRTHIAYRRGPQITRLYLAPNAPRLQIIGQI